MLSIKRLLLLVTLAFIISCSSDGEEKKVVEKDIGAKVEEQVSANQDAGTKVEVQATTTEIAPTKVDIMKPLNGTDPCFMAVEIIRDEGDVAMFRDLGDSIILKDTEKATDSHRTYMGIVGKMLKDKKSIAEIRQTLLNTCQLLKKVKK